MGLFDDVICMAPLPDGYDGVDFQTKTFPEPYMEKYTITADGRLMWAAHWKDEPVEKDFHGILNFYTNGHDDKWHEYNAKFTDGRLVKIELVADSDKP